MKRLLPFLVLLCCVTNSFALQGSDILTRARLMLRDTSNDPARQRFSDTQLLNWLNDGQREANATNMIFMSSVSFPLVAGTTAYSLPADFVATWRVTLNGMKLDQTSYNEQDANATGWQNVKPGTPINYDIYETTAPTIEFYPAPSVQYISASTSVVAGIWYLQQSIDLTTTSGIPFNGWIQLYPYQSYLAYYITYRGLWTVGDMDQAQQYLVEWTQGLGAMKMGMGRMPDFNPGFAGRRNN